MFPWMGNRSLTESGLKSKSINILQLRFWMWKFTGLRMTLWLKMTCIWNFRKETMTVCPWKGWLGGMTEVCNLTYVDLFLKIQLVDPTGPSIYDRSIQGFCITSHLVFVRLGNLNRKSSNQTNFLKIFWLFESMSCISHSLKKNSGIFFCTKKTWSPIKTVGVFESIKMTSQLVNWRGCFSWRGMHKVEPLEPTPEVRCWIVTLETQDLSCSHQGGRICRLVFSDAKGILVLYLQIAKYLVWCEKFPGIFEVHFLIKWYRFNLEVGRSWFFQWGTVGTLEN